MARDVISEAEMAAYRRRWEAGDFRGVIDAFEHCHNWTAPLPDWLAGTVHYALQIAFAKAGAPGRGKTGGFAKQAERIDRDHRRWLAANVCLSRGRGTTEAEALEQARTMLAGTTAQGSAVAIRKSYYRVQKQLRNSA